MEMGDLQASFNVHTYILS